MRDDVRRDMEKSITDVYSMVIPTLIKHCPEFGPADILPVEALKQKHPVLVALDTLAGFDAVQRCERGLRGIAFRLQRGHNWRTFTIRVDRPGGMITEYDKRMFALHFSHAGWLSPYWTVHAYTDAAGDNLLSVGLAQTLQLYRYIEQQRHVGYQFPYKSMGDAGFIAVSWDAYRRSDNYFFEYPTPVPTHREPEKPRVLVPQPRNNRKSTVHLQLSLSFCEYDIQPLPEERKLSAEEIDTFWHEEQEELLLRELHHG